MGTVGFQSTKVLLVLVLGEGVRDGVVSNVANESAVTADLLDQVVFTGHTDGVVLADLVAELHAGDCLKLESFNELVLGGVALLFHFAV